MPRLYASRLYSEEIIMENNKFSETKTFVSDDGKTVTTVTVSGNSTSNSSTVTFTTTTSVTTTVKNEHNSKN